MSQHSHNHPEEYQPKIETFSQDDAYTDGIREANQNAGLRSDIEDIRCLLEEANESGDLEERLSIAERLAQLEAVELMHRQKATKATFHECGLCKGFGKHKEYEDEWPCNSCLGTGGWWS